MTASTTPTRDEHGRLASAKLGTIDCVAQSLSVGPITSAALLGGIVAAYGGSSGPIYLIVATLGVFCLGGVLVMFARKYIGAGAIYDYVAQTFGATTGIATAGFYYLAYIILGGPAMLIGGGVLGSQMLERPLRHRGEVVALLARAAARLRRTQRARRGDLGEARAGDLRAVGDAVRHHRAGRHRQGRPRGELARAVQPELGHVRRLHALVHVRRAAVRRCGVVRLAG